VRASEEKRKVTGCARIGYKGRVRARFEDNCLVDSEKCADSFFVWDRGRGIAGVKCKRWKQ